MPETKPPDQLAREMQQRYRNTFSTGEGRRVMGDILTLGHFGETIDPNNPAAVAEHNFAVVIARMAGVFDGLYRELGMDKEN